MDSIERDGNYCVNCANTRNNVRICVCVEKGSDRKLMESHTHSERAQWTMMWWMTNYSRMKKEAMSGDTTGPERRSDANQNYYYYLQAIHLIKSIHLAIIEYLHIIYLRREWPRGMPACVRCVCMVPMTSTTSQSSAFISLSHKL